ncbi:hypothetical protein RRF57_003362 [Xylaria bambusicola]|uniref:Uncharacterized protein n=1 Tax=Xylaria bambusicola TaxID=326684 RepID=A0AAN7Z2Q1_9PEZI
MNFCFFPVSTSHVDRGLSPTLITFDSFGSNFKLGLRMMLLAVVVASGLAALIPVSAAYEADIGLLGSCPFETREQLESCNAGRKLDKKQGAYSYRDNVPYLNITSTSATLTVTVTSTDVFTETVGPSLSPTGPTTQVTDASFSGYTSMSTAAVTATPSDTFHAETVTIICNCTPTPSGAENSNSNLTTSRAQSNPDTIANTAISSACSCADASASSEQPSSTQVTRTVTSLYVTVTTTVVYSTSDCEEYTGTEIVTMTPYVTITRGTTITISSATKASVDGSTLTLTNQSASTVTMTVYIPQSLTQSQTGASSGSPSAANITISEVVTATVVQTVSPVPSGPLTSSRSTITRRSTLTITVSARSVTSTNDVSPIATTLRSSVDTACKKTSSASNSTSGFTTRALSTPTSRAPYSVGISIHESVRTINSTGTDNVANLPPPGNVTSNTVTKHTIATYTPNIHHPGSTVTAFPINATVPISAGESLGKKRPIKVSWGDTDGTYSQTCIILLVMIISLFL